MANVWARVRLGWVSHDPPSNHDQLGLHWRRYPFFRCHDFHSL